MLGNSLVAGFLGYGWGLSLKVLFEGSSLVEEKVLENSSKKRLDPPGRDVFQGSETPNNP
jgi:hypothetical protein